MLMRRLIRLNNVDLSAPGVSDNRPYNVFHTSYVNEDENPSIRPLQWENNSSGIVRQDREKEIAPDLTVFRIVPRLMYGLYILACDVMDFGEKYVEDTKVCIHNLLADLGLVHTLPVLRRRTMSCSRII